VAVQMTGNAMYDSVGSIIVGNLLGLVCFYSCMFTYIILAHIYSSFFKTST
jgi:hypothetical protein